MPTPTSPDPSGPFVYTGSTGSKIPIASETPKMTSTASTKVRVSRRSGRSTGRYNQNGASGRRRCFLGCGCRRVAHDDAGRELDAQRLDPLPLDQAHEEAHSRAPELGQRLAHGR